MCSRKSARGFRRRSARHVQAGRVPRGYQDWWGGLDMFVLRSMARQKKKCCSEHFGDRAVGNQPRSSESKRKIHVRGGCDIKCLGVRGRAWPSGSRNPCPLGQADVKYPLFKISILKKRKKFLEGSSLNQSATYEPRLDFSC